LKKYVKIALVVGLLAFISAGGALWFATSSVTTGIKSIDSVKASFHDSVEDYINDFEIVVPFINQMGYDVNQIDIELGLIPTVVVYLNRHAVVSIEDQKKVIEYCKFQGFSPTILESLLKVSKLQNKINLGSYKFSTVELQLAPIPAANLVFLPEE